MRVPDKLKVRYVLAISIGLHLYIDLLKLIVFEYVLCLYM